MNEERNWEVVEAALGELLALSAADRPAALERLAGSDAGLKHELESLLAYADGEDSVLDLPAINALTPKAAPSGSLGVGQRIGAYRIVELIGRGGMGEVYRAERADDQFEQQVALKLIRHEAAEHLHRFQAERRILARLEHPGIARLHDGGIAPDGRPFMAMELVAGRSITEWCREHACGLEERLRLFAEVCDAVSYAHRNLVIHRDLKPGNVLVTDAGAVKLLDFGVAKLLEAESSDGAHTHAPMSPSHAAPEQLTGSGVTTATDVYALGMLLFELLTGDRPWRLGDQPMAANLDRILHEAPPAPSQFAARQARPPLPAKRLRGDLDAIVAKALRKEPAQRYETVNALREDVLRGLSGEPVAARQGVRGYVFARFLRRYRVQAAGLALLLIAMLAGTAGIAWQAHIAKAQFARADIEARKATAVKDFLLDIFEQNSYARAGTEQAQHATAEQLLDTGARKISSEFSDLPAVRGELTDTLADLYLNDLAEYDRVVALERAWLEELRRSDGDRPSLMKAAAQSRLGQALSLSLQPGAEEPLRAALLTLDRLGDDRSELRATTLLGLSQVLDNDRPPGDPEALQDALTALHILETFHPDSEQRMFALGKLADIAYLQLDDAEAEHWYREEYALAESPGRPNAAFWLVVVSDELGNFLRTRHRYSEAEPYLRRAVAEAVRIDPDERLLTSTSKEPLGRLLLQLNHPEEGQSMLADALREAERSQGVDDISRVAVMRYELASLLNTRGELAEASELLRHNLDVYSRAGDSGHSWTFVEYAQLLFEQGRLDEARAMASRAEDYMTSRHLTRYDGYGTNLVTKANIDLAQGRSASAMSGYLQVATGWPPSSEYISPQYSAAVIGLAQLQLDARHGQEAIDSAQTLLSQLLALKEHEHMASFEADARRMLGVALTRNGGAGEAEPQLRRAVALRQMIDVADSPWLAEARIGLADCLVDEGRSAEAGKLLDLAEQALRKHAALAPSYGAELRAARMHLANTRQPKPAV